MTEETMSFSLYRCSTQMHVNGYLGADHRTVSPLCPVARNFPPLTLCISESRKTC